MTTVPAFELYLTPAQQNRPVHDSFPITTLVEIESHLEAEGLIGRTFSLQDDLVKGWLADPSTYPDELKGKRVYLWKSTQAFPKGSTDLRDREVAYLVWDRKHERPFEQWLWLVGVASDESVALLRQS